MSDEEEIPQVGLLDMARVLSEFRAVWDSNHPADRVSEWLAKEGIDKESLQLVATIFAESTLRKIAETDQMEEVLVASLEAAITTGWEFHKQFGKRITEAIHE